MKNRILSVLTSAVLLLLVLLPLSLAGADAYGSWDDEMNAYVYPETHYGIVMCRQMRVRNKASTSGTSYGDIKNGQPVKILGITEKEDFYVLDLESCGFKGVGRGSFGYAKASLIRIDPEFVATTRTTNTYATPWSTELKNGEQANRFFLLIDEYKNWYAVQLMETTPGTAFIRTGDIGQYSSYGNAFVVTWDAKHYDEETWDDLGTVKRFTPCRLVTSNSGKNSISDEYSLVVFNEGAKNEYSAWILNQYIAPLRN